MTNLSNLSNLSPLLHEGEKGTLQILEPPGKRLGVVVQVRQPRGIIQNRFLEVIQHLGTGHRDTTRRCDYGRLGAHFIPARANQT